MPQDHLIYELGQTYIRFDLKVTTEFKAAFEQYLYEKGKHYAQELFHKDLVVDEFHFKVELEDGSLKARLKIFGKIAINALVLIGGIRSGVDYLIQDSRNISQHIVQDIRNEPNIDPNCIGRVERRLGVPGKIKRLYEDIEYLQLHKDELSEKEQVQLINRISNRYNNLIILFEDSERLLFQNDLKEQQIFKQIKKLDQQTQLPFPTEDFYYPNDKGVRDELEQEELRLPQPEKK